MFSLTFGTGNIVRNMKPSSVHPCNMWKLLFCFYPAHTKKKTTFNEMLQINLNQIIKKLVFRISSLAGIFIWKTFAILRMFVAKHSSCIQKPLAQSLCVVALKSNIMWGIKRDLHKHHLNLMVYLSRKRRNHKPKLTKRNVKIFPLIVFRPCCTTHVTSESPREK